MTTTEETISIPVAQWAMLKQMVESALRDCLDFQDASRAKPGTVDVENATASLFSAMKILDPETDAQDPTAPLILWAVETISAIKAIGDASFNESAEEAPMPKGWCEYYVKQCTPDLHAYMLDMEPGEELTVVLCDHVQEWYRNPIGMVDLLAMAWERGIDITFETHRSG